MVEKQKISTGVIFVILVLIILGSYIFNKPAITGRAIEGKESVFSERLNLQVNESSTYEWQVKNPGSIKSLKMSGSVTSNGSAKVYIEKNGTRQIIFDSKKQLFDVDVYVLPEYKKISQGDEMLLQIVLFNLRGFGKGDINVEYSVKDSKGNLIATQKEGVYVETQAKFVRKLLMPEELKPGTYVAFVEASTNSTIVGTSSDTFELVSKYPYRSITEFRNYLIGLALLVGIGIIIILLLFWRRELNKKRKIAELRESQPAEKIQKLEKELKAFEEGYKTKLISDESYKKGKARIEKELKKFKK